MTCGDWEAATPKCPKGEVSNIPGAICSEPMRWARPGFADPPGEMGGTWWCPVHGLQLTGVEVARRAGYAGMWFDEAA